MNAFQSSQFLLKNWKSNCLNNWPQNRNNSDFEVALLFCKSLRHVLSSFHIVLWTMAGKNQNSGPRDWKPSAKLILEDINPIFWLIFHGFRIFIPPASPTISLVCYLDNWVLLSLSQHLLGTDKGCAMLTTVQNQKKKILSPISQPGQLEENLGSLATLYYSVGDDRMGGSGSSSDFLIYQIFPQLSSPYRASD